jgi:hypothetical protein
MKFKVDALAVSLIATMLVGCGGEGTTSAPPIITVPGVTPVAPPTPPVVKTRFDKVVSASVLSGGNETSSPNLKLYYEGIAVEDVNGDGHKDLIITNLGDPGKAVTDKDPPISIFLNDGKNKLIVADTTRLAPAGWVNDYVFLDSNKNGVKEIIAIDHGRELAGPPFPGTQLRAYEWDGTKFAELTSKTSGNTPAYNHSSSNSGDLNDDGLLDFTVATISSSSKLYYGDSTTIFKLGAEYSFSDFGSTGTTAILPKERIAVFLPYDTWDKANTDFNNAEFVKNGVISRQDARTGVLPSNYGYSLINVADINGDGLTDFVALGENPNTGGDGKRVFVTFMQNVSGKFDILTASLVNHK